MSANHSKRLQRSRDARMIAGVCGGLGEYFNLDPTLIRLIFAILALTTGMPVLLYLILWIIMPLASPDATLTDDAGLGTPAPALQDTPAAGQSFTQDEVKAWDLEPAGVKPESEG